MQHTPSDPFALLVDVLAERVAAKVLDLLAGRMPPMAANEASVTTGLVDKGDLAQSLGVSVATIDRMARDGMPYETVGTRRRFDVRACRAWVAARGKRATTTSSSKHRTDDVDDAALDAIAHSAGLRPS